VIFLDESSVQKAINQRDHVINRRKCEAESAMSNNGGGAPAADAPSSGGVLFIYVVLLVVVLLLFRHYMFIQIVMVQNATFC